MLAGLGTSLHGSQTKAHHAIQSRFAERAKLSAALTESLFASSASVSQARDAQLFGGEHVSSKRLAREAGRGHLVNLVLLRADGSIVARSPRTPAAIARAIERGPAFIRAALHGSSFTLSDMLRLPGAPATIQFAQPFDTPNGRRVLVSGFEPRLVAGFVSGYLAEIPDSAGGHAYVLDGRGAVMGGSGGSDGVSCENRGSGE